MSNLNNQSVSKSESSECEKPTLEDQLESFLLLLQELRATNPERYRGYLLRLSDLITDNS